MARATPWPVAFAAIVSVATCHPSPAESVQANEFGWPLVTYTMFVNVLGAGDREDSHAVAHGVHRDGWSQHLDRSIQPLLDGPNPPAKILVHCVGPAWPRMENGVAKRIAAKGGYIQRWFEYDWPLTVAVGREREDGNGRWPALPAYLEDFAESWRGVAEGERSRGWPVETFAYTGMLQTPWLEALRVEDPEAYRERLTEVARFFRDAGFAGMYVDAASEHSLAEGHLGLSVLREINEWPDFFVGVEAYPRASHDDTTGPLRYFMMAGGLSRQHPGWRGERPTTWQSRLKREGMILWPYNRRLGKKATPELAQLTIARGDGVAIAWTQWAGVAGHLPLQQTPRLPGRER